MDKKQLTSLVIRIDRVECVERDGDRECFAQVQAAPAMSLVRHPHAGLLAMPSGRRFGRADRTLCDRGQALRAGRLAGFAGATRRRLAINARWAIQSGWSKGGFLFAGAAAFQQRTPGRKQEPATASYPSSVELGSDAPVVPAVTANGV